jgi:hypothetical protein
MALLVQDGYAYLGAPIIYTATYPLNTQHQERTWSCSKNAFSFLKVNWQIK